MPIYTLETGDGRRLKIEADTPDAATAEANAWSAANPIQPKESAVSEAISNIPSSAAKYASDIVEPFLSPIETAKSLGEVGKGLYSKAAGALGAKQNPEEKAQTEAAANAIGQMFKERYGSGAAIEETFRKDPVSILGDLSAVFTLGGGAAARAPGIIGRAGQVVAKTGDVIDPLMAAGRGAQAAGGLLGKTTAELTGVASGAGAAPIRQAYEAGRRLPHRARHRIGSV